MLFTDVHTMPDTIAPTATNLFSSTGFTGWTGKTLVTFSLGYHTTTGNDARELATVTFFVADLMAVPQTATAGTVSVTAPGVSQNAIAFPYHDRAAEGNGETGNMQVDGVLIVSFGRTGAGELLVSTIQHQLRVLQREGSCLLRRPYMADIVYGQPVQTGDGNGTQFNILLTGTRGDGTRRITVERTSVVGLTGMVHAAQNGYIPSKGVRKIGTTDAQFLEEGRWLSFLDEDGFADWVDEPVTPGDDFYKFRDILSHHAHRFVVEHNPANLRYTNTDDRRIEHLAHELSNQDRMRAGNVSSLVRPNIGHLWGTHPPLRPDAIGGSGLEGRA